MMKKSVIFGIIILIAIIGIIFISGCTQQEEDGTGNGQNGDGGEAIIPF